VKLQRPKFTREHGKKTRQSLGTAGLHASRTDQVEIKTVDHATMLVRRRHGGMRKVHDCRGAAGDGQNMLSASIIPTPAVILEDSMNVETHAHMKQ